MFDISEDIYYLYDSNVPTAETDVNLPHPHKIIEDSILMYFCKKKV